VASQLVIVEGLPGSGKSTLSQAISIATTQAGRVARWYSELELNHPLANAYPPEETGSLEEYFATCRASWLKFLEDHARHPERTCVVEAWLLQDLVFGLLADDVPRDAIIQGMNELWRLLPVATTTVVYLGKRDVSQAVRDVCEQRGAPMAEFYVSRNDDSPFARSRNVRGLPGLIQFWSEHRALSDEIIGSSGLRTFTRDVSRYDWPPATAELLSALDLAVPWAENEDLTPFIGSYVLDESTGTTFEVVERARCLYLAGFPFFWRSADARLKPLGHGTFAVESWPATVRFDRLDGVARALTVSEEQRFGKPPWPAGTYVRALSR
jgi:hypothetical protein